MTHQGMDEARCTRPVWGGIRGATVPQDNLIVTPGSSIGENPCSRSVMYYVVSNGEGGSDGRMVGDKSDETKRQTDGRIVIMSWEGMKEGCPRVEWAPKKYKSGVKRD